MDDASLITSELVSNGARASSALEVPSPVGLRLLANSQRLVIEVAVWAEMLLPRVQ